MASSNSYSNAVTSKGSDDSDYPALASSLNKASTTSTTTTTTTKQSTPAAKDDASSSLSSSSDQRASLQTKAASIREIMVAESNQHGKVLERHPNLVHALGMFDEQLDKLRDAGDTEAARTVYDSLLSARDQFLDALRQLQQTEAGQAVSQTARNLAGAAQAKYDEFNAGFKTEQTTNVKQD